LLTEPGVGRRRRYGCVPCHENNPFLPRHRPSAESDHPLTTIVNLMNTGAHPDDLQSLDITTAKMQ